MVSLVVSDTFFLARKWEREFELHFVSFSASPAFSCRGKDPSPQGSLLRALMTTPSQVVDEGGKTVRKPLPNE